MASLSPAPDIKNTSKLPQYGARRNGAAQHRDIPLFTAMRRPQFQQEFTTESLNNTAVASPSPARPTRGALGRNKHQGRGGGLSAAFRRVEGEDKQDGNRERSHLNRRGGRASATRPALARQYVSETPNAVSKMAPSRKGTRTPSPPRGRALDQLLSPMSEVSESSPPREFAEAYRQINDAEDVAAQDDELDFSDETEEPLPAEQNQRLLAPAIASRQSSRRRSPGPDDAIVLDLPDVKPNDIIDESLPSLPSDLDQETGLGLSQRDRDLRRLNNTLGNVRSFSKARRRSQSGLDEMARNERNSQSDSRSGNSNTSGSILSDGSLNIPQTWGRKARQGKTLLSRVTREGSQDEDLPAMSNNVADIATRTRTIQDWQAEASMTPLPAIPDQDSLEHSPSPAPTKHYAFSSRERVRQLAFGHSSAPAPGVSQTTEDSKNSALDLIREREMQTLVERAANTNRLTELLATQPPEDVLDRSANTLADKEGIPVNAQTYGSRLKPQPSQTNLPGVTNAFHKSRAGSIPYGDDVFGASPQPPASVGNVERTTSKQKAPAAASQRPIDSEEEGHVIQYKANKTPKEPLKSDSGPVPQILTPAPSKTQTYLKTPLVTGAWIDTPMPVVDAKSVKLEPKEEENKESIQRTLRGLDLEDLARGSEIIQEAETRQQSLQETAPRLPGSALAAIINRAKEKKAAGANNPTDDTLILDDSTILSLEDLLANAGESDSSTSEPSSAVVKSGNKASSKLTRLKLRKSRRDSSSSESDDAAGLTSRLDRLRTSIRDTRSSVGSLQKRIGRLPSTAGTSRASSTSRAHSECEEAGEFHDFIWPCEKCGRRSGTSVKFTDDGPIFDWQWRPLQIYMPQLWYWPADSTIPYLTRLGLWSTALISIIAIEIVLCDIYSPPFYASSMVGYGVDIYAPRPPFILPQLFWRHVLSSPLTAFGMLLQVFIRLFTSIFGVPAGVFAPPGDIMDTTSSNSKWSYKAGLVGRDGLDVMGMDADEML